MKRRIILTLISLSLLIGFALWSVGRGAQAKASLGASAVAMATINVSNADDAGPGSLRQAIADAMPGDTITVAQSPAGPYPVGSTQVTLTVTDNHGASSTCQATVTVLYSFNGFFQPVDNLPTVNVVNAGRAIPIKFSLGGDKGLNIFAESYPRSAVIACDFSGGTSDIEETVTAGGSSLSYDAATDAYTYVWKTNSAWKNTCRKLTVKLNDGSEYAANFKFK